jgi:hypothetical protein
MAVVLASFFDVGADTVTLNDGEKLEGRIVSETPGELTIEVKVSAGVLDQRTIQKSDIKELERQTPDDLAYQQIKDIAPGASSLAAAKDYDAIIEKLGAFTKEFPDSAHTADVTRVLQEFTQEKSRVEAGEFKFGGKWLGREEFEKQKPEIMAGLLYDTMKNCSAAGDLVGAMNALDQLERKYPGATTYPEAIELGRRVLVALQQSVARWRAKLQYDMQQWKQGVELTVEPKKSQLIAAYNTEQLRYDTALAAAEKAGQKWKPLLPRSEKSLTALQTIIPTELQRLNAIDLEKIRRSVQLTKDAQQSIASNELAAAETNLTEARTLWPTNAAVAALQAKLAELKSRAAATPAAQPAAEAKAALAAAAAAAAQQAQAAAAVPFYRTPMGASAIVVGVLVVLGVASLASRLMKPRDEAPKSE